MSGSPFAELASGGAAPSWESLARSAGRGLGAEASVPLREFLCFSIDGDAYAVPVERVREIVRWRQITPVPRVPPAIRGVMSLRGQITQVVDLRIRFGLAPSLRTRRGRIIVLHGENGSATGLLVDSVSEVVRVPESDVMPPPAGDSEFVEALCKRGRDFISQIDLDRILDLDGHR